MMRTPFGENPFCMGFRQAQIAKIENKQQHKTAVFLG
jgi:hypothetical protein